MNVLQKLIYVGQKVFARILQEVLCVNVSVASHSTRLGLAVKVGAAQSVQFHLILLSYIFSHPAVVQGRIYSIRTKSYRVYSD